MAESSTMDEEEDRAADLAEYLRLGMMLALAAVNLWMMWDAVKERPDVLVMRQRVRDAIAGRWRQYRDMRRAEKHVVFEAMQAVTEKEEQP